MFGDILRELRTQRGLTQDQLAEMAGLAKSTISMYENGRREPDLETLELLADIFNVDMNRLSGRTKPAASGEDDELQEYLDFLKNREEGRMLFSLAKNATKEDVMRAVAIIDALRKEEEGRSS